MLSIRSSIYELPGPVKIRFFKYEEKFLNHLKRHFISPEEPWSRFLGKDKIARWGKITEDGPVFMIEDAYRNIVSLLDKGIRFSAKKPIYIRYTASRRYRDGSTQRIDGYHFLSKEGFIVTVVNKVVRTAYFVGTRPDESSYTYFRQGWSKLSCKASQGSYRDYEAGINYYNSVSEKRSPENWNDCPDFRSDEKKAEDLEYGSQSQERKKGSRYSLLAEAWQKALMKSAGRQQVQS